MSADSDRIAVPTNGRGPHAVSDTTPASVASPGAAGAPTAEEMSVAFSFKQLAIGLGIVASLVLLLVGRTRRRRPDDPDGAD